jgi:hypothetical protein
MGYRTNQCSACGGYGHNRRACPGIKAAYEKVLKVCAKYGIEPDPEIWRSSWLEPLREKQKAAHGVKDYYEVHHIDDDEYISNWDANRFQEHGERLADRVARMSLEAAGIVPGALIQYREFDYITRDYVDRIGMVQSIDWSKLGQQDIKNSSGLGNVLEYWLFRGNQAIIIKDHEGRNRHVGVPRNIEQQSDYFVNTSDSYNLLCPVHGSRVNLDGYEGDSKFPVSMPVYMWGGKWVSKRFGNKVIKAIKEVGSELIVA